jgi:hypothetical protein
MPLKFPASLNKYPQKYLTTLSLCMRILPTQSDPKTMHSILRYDDTAEVMNLWP